MEEKRALIRHHIITFCIFAGAFCAFYLGLCFLIPGLRIKLEAPPMEYFFSSLSHLVLIKALVSVFGAVCVLAAYHYLRKILKKDPPPPSYWDRYGQE